MKDIKILDTNEDGEIDIEVDGEEFAIPNVWSEEFLPDGLLQATDMSAEEFFIILQKLYVDHPKV